MFRLGARIPQFPISQGVRFNSSKSSSRINNQYIMSALKDKSNTQKSTLKQLDALNFKRPTQKRPTSLRKEEFQSFLSQNELKAKPKDVAAQLRITGPRAGRMVRVINNDVDSAFRTLRGIVTANNIKGDKADQRFYIKPGKKQELKTINKNKRVFMQGFRRMMEVVKDASRRGY